ncbi:hypothetical protein D3C71_2035100 [compost metagenome]
MKQAAMASSSKLVPALGVAALSRAANTRPDMAASTPMLTNTQKVTALVLTPDSLAAFSLPPRA